MAGDREAGPGGRRADPGAGAGRGRADEDPGGGGGVVRPGRAGPDAFIDQLPQIVKEASAGLAGANVNVLNGADVARRDRRRSGRPGASRSWTRSARTWAARTGTPAPPSSGTWVGGERARTTVPSTSGRPRRGCGSLTRRRVRLVGLGAAAGRGCVGGCGLVVAGRAVPRAPGAATDAGHPQALRRLRSGSGGALGPAPLPVRIRRPVQLRRGWSRSSPRPGAATDAGHPQAPPAIESGGRGGALGRSPWGGGWGGRYSGLVVIMRS